MKTMFSIVSMILMLAIGTRAGEPSGCTTAEQQQWMQSTLHEIQTLKVGMTRADLMKVFTRTSGFFTSTRTTGTYTYIGCPYIRVDVEFSPASNDSSTDSPKDVIKAISKPYLAMPQYD